jgi:hypothetical protein
VTAKAKLSFFFSIPDLDQTIEIPFIMLSQILCKDQNVIFTISSQEHDTKILFVKFRQVAYV